MKQTALGMALSAFVIASSPCQVQATAFAAIKAVPQDTASFLPYCRDHQDVCVSAITDVNNEILIEQLYGKYGCPYPKPGGATAAERHLGFAANAGKVLDWLADNSSARVATTNEAIRQAIAALWPAQCQNGSAVLRAP